ncbi:MAG: hypothetical protein RRA92_03705 [Gemmatimonadota bacterium]|nr:hypothetical protein [Gemmatimonadota bacterium]
MSEPRSRAGRRLLAGGAVLGLLLAAGAVAIGDVSPEAKRAGASSARQSVSLFATPALILRTNQIECGIDNAGNVCSNVFNSPTAAGGAWPVGTPNAYIFNTGLQIAGIMAAGAGPWANDTVGAYFFDARGTQPSGAPLTNIFDSRNPEDVANWPADAIVSDPDLFNDALLGRVSVSQQDTWVRYWDGDPTRITNRQHPMGIEVTQRSLAWNFPFGNEAVLYFLYTFRNATGDQEFQDLNELAFFGGDDRLPNEGITIEELYAAFSTDMDVANAGENFSSAVLPFDIGMSYQGGFDAPEFSYPPDIFFPPFFTEAPGIVGIKYLRSPIDPETGEEIGLTLFSATLNQDDGFPDPLGDKQLWRYLSGKLNPAAGDFPCSETPEVDTGIPETTERSICFLFQSAADTRFYQASGPFTLEPGQEATIVVAYIIAATVRELPNGDLSGIDANSDPNANPPGTPSFHPGFPSARGCDVNGENCSVFDPENEVKALERGAGWVEYTGPLPSGRGNGALEGPENKLPIFDATGQPLVEVVPGSLLGKALVAQTIFNNKFLLGFAPDQPNFFLVPGNNQVTILWEDSPTEELGDPFFTVASDPTSALFNPNYREFDVEGYRVFRGTTPSDLVQIAQFDKANSTYTDITCETVLPGDDLHDFSSAPEETFGFVGGEECPEDFEKVSSINSDLFFNNGTAGGAPGLGVVRLANGDALGTNLTQVGVDDFTGVQLQDTGIPFAFNDPNVTNNFTYFYAVSAFDVNSLASGPYTLESSRVSDPVTPRNDTQNLDFATFESFIAGENGPLNPNAQIPSIDSEDGTFSGPFPPTNSVDLAFAPLVDRLIGAFELSARIDSIVPTASPGSSFGTPTAECANGGDPFSACLKHYLTINDSGEMTSVVIDVYNPWWSSFGEGVPQQFTLVQAQVPFDQAALADFGIPSASGSAVATGTFNEALNNSAAEGPQNRRVATPLVRHGGSRWFSGANESVADPAAFTRVGHLDGVDTVWAPISHTPLAAGLPVPPNGSVSFEKQCFSRALAKLGRAADVEFRWDGTGVTAWDVTHDVEVPFKPTAQASYGFLTTDANGNGFIDWQDFNYIDNALQILRLVGGGNCDAAAGTSWDPGGVLTPVQLTDTPAIVPVSIDGLDQTGIAGLTQTGQGFGLFVNGERYIFQLSALPAAGTVWTLRTFSGAVVSNEATFDAADPTEYGFVIDYTGTTTGQRPMIVPGLTLGWRAQTATTVAAATDLRDVHTVPDPYLATSQFDRAPTSKQLMFVNLPPRATIRIYTLTGVLVDQFDHDDPTGGGRAVWDLRNRNNQFVASGVYFYHVVTPEGNERVGKFTIINFAGQN